MTRTHIGEFRIIRRLGKGGMGTVYLCHDQSVGRYVAVKTLSKALSADASFIKRFQREVKVAAALNHPNSVSIYSAGQDEDIHYYVMEYVEGNSVGELIEKQGNLAPDFATEILIQVCSALQAGYEKAGIIHRDIKPDNILINEGGIAKLADFGLAKGKEDVRITKTGMVFGSPLYMPPEQWQEGDVDCRSDIYSLGVMYYHMLIGEPPFRGEAGELMSQHLNKRIELPRDVVSEVPAEIASIIIRMTQKRKENRYQSYLELLEKLEALRPWLEKARRASASVPSPVPLEKTEEPREKTKLIFIGAAALILCLVFGYFLLRGGKPKEVEVRDKVVEKEGGIQELPGRMLVKSAPQEASMEVDSKDTVKKDTGESVLKERKVQKLGDAILNSIGMKLVYIEPGTFEMGSYDGEGDELPVHNVRISRGFYLGACEVTQEEYGKVMGKNPSRFNRDSYPVMDILWEEALEFCEKLTKIERKIGNLPGHYLYRLPTEAEWEYACRAGTTTPFCFGNKITTEQANYDNKHAYNAKAEGTYRGRPMSVKGFLPNAWGLHDMHGNVWEWCADWYSWDYYSNGADRDPQGPGSGIYRVLRGGCWDSYSPHLRSANRHKELPGIWSVAIGFRCALGS